MRFSEYISSEVIAPDLAGKNKDEILLSLAGLAACNRRVQLSTEQIYDAFAARERLATTGVGSGVAIPHGRFAMPDFAIAVGFCPGGVEFEAIDGAPVRILVAILAPEGNPAAQLRMLARVSRLLRPVELRESLLSTRDIPEILALLRGADSALGQ